jgi:hypothetical protein
MSNYNSALEELDRLESNYRLQDPRTAPGEVEKIVAEEMRRAGVNVAAVQQSSSAQSESLRKRIFAAAAQFTASRPESDSVNGFLPSEANEKVLLEYMDANDLDFTSPHCFEQAFLATRDRLTPPTSRRQSAQVRVRKVDGVEISHESLDKLSAKELDKLLLNPRAVQLINELPPRSR